MLIIRGSYISSGVDYITLTEVTEGGIEGVAPKLWNMLATDKELVKTKWGGYSGWAQGGIKIGTRERSGKVDNIFVASGSDAAWVICQNVRQFTSALRCTRVDVQVTVELDQPDIDLAKSFFEDMKRNKRYKQSMVGRRKITMFDSEDGQTLYIGKRVSKGMIVRIYDKSLSYDLPLGSAWRFEIEFKRDLADSALSMVNGPSGLCIGVAKDTLAGQFGVLIPGSDGAPQEIAVRRDTTNTVEWLRTCVKPVVTRRIVNGELESTLDALGLSWVIGREADGQKAQELDASKQKEAIKVNTENDQMLYDET